ncbi:MAG: DUF1367 family protein [Proteobacteria bacterium]|nr:DUF1367 family protein [Pseudomonadota bacterium]
MASEIFLRKNRFNKLEPTDRRSEEAMESLPTQHTLRAVISQPRNVKHHKKFFALLGIVLENQDHFQTTDELLYAIKLRLGYVKPIQIRGEIGYMPKSISFAKMDQRQFTEFYERVLDFIVQDVIPGMDAADLERELEGF